MKLMSRGIREPVLSQKVKGQGQSATVQGENRCVDNLMPTHSSMALGLPGPALGMFEVFGRTGPQNLGGRNFGPYKN